MLLKEGCQFLSLTPVKEGDLVSALNHLQIFYRHVPSITTYPVYLGNLDTLLEPYLTDDESLNKLLLKNFLINLDRTITDSFVHANIGPKATRTGQLLLELEGELQNAVPNLTLKYDPALTSDDFALKAIKSSFLCSKPCFANHVLYQQEYGGDNYGIASCYNGLQLGGGGYTLTRLNLKALALWADTQDLSLFLEKKLPEIMKLQLELTRKRMDFLVKDSGFFENNFLVKEGFLKADRFVCMVGMIGLAEAAETLAGEDKSFGKSQKALSIAEKILIKATEIIKEANKKSGMGHDIFALHAQSGIGSDRGTSPGCRVPVTQVPELIYDHVLYVSTLHKYFPTGCSEIFSFDQTAPKHPEAILDIIKGSMKKGLRMFAFYSADSDLVRVTGYLVKKSEMKKQQNHQAVLHDTVSLGSESITADCFLDRKVRDSQGKKK
jgi:YjjI family glycine radical enzyme